MPIYEYKCKKCGEVWEEILPVGVNKKLTCAKCGGTSVRVPSVPSINFKGEGWTKKFHRNTCPDGSCKLEGK